MTPSSKPASIRRIAQGAFQRLRGFPYYLPLLSSFPVLFLFGQNSNALRPNDVLRPLVVANALALCLWLATGVLSRKWAESAALSSLAVLFLLSYGHAYDWIKSLGATGAAIGRHRFLLPMGLLILILCAVYLYRTSRRPLWTSAFLNVIGLTLVLLPMAAIAQAGLAQQQRVEVTILDDGGAELVIPALSGEQPDIYYIILDAYARQDLLLGIYDYDNSGFIQALERMGFYVAADSRSNYIQTELSLISSLNLAYVDDLSRMYGFDLDMIPAADLIGSSRVRAILEQVGYQTAAFDTGFRSTTIRDADVFFEAPGGPSHQNEKNALNTLSAFEGLLIETSALRPFADRFGVLGISRPINVFQPSYESHRETVRSILSRLRTIPDLEGDYFVFAHVLAPHPPFVFGPSGEPLNPDRAFTLADGSSYMRVGTREEYLSLYPGQLEYLNTLVLETLGRILEKSEPRPIIILQGDHGPGAFLDWDSPEASNLVERTSILNAYLLPEDVAAELYPSISPVNSFRLLLREYLDLPFPPLKDMSFFSFHEGPLGLIPID